MMRKGTLHELETIRKIRHSVIARFPILWLMATLDGKSSELTENLTLWARTKGLNKGALWDLGISNRKTYRKSHKGWRAVRIDISRLSVEKLAIVTRHVAKDKDQKIRNKFNRFKPVYSKPTGQSIKEIYEKATLQASGDDPWLASHRGDYNEFCSIMNKARRFGGSKEALETEIYSGYDTPDWFDKRFWNHYWKENP